jgi:hypothetical protein
MTADRIGIALRGRRNGKGWLVSCPCPNHGNGRGDRNPSLSVTDGDGGRLLLKCFAGCEFEEIIDELRPRGLVDSNCPSPVPSSSQVIRPPKWHLPDAEVRELLKSCRPPHNTPVQEYLERRGLPILLSTLRYTEYENKPAMAAVVQRPDGVEIAVQRTFLTKDGEKANVRPQKMTTGALGTGAVRLGFAAEVMGIAEGVETALSARFLTEIPVWASLGAGRLHQIELPSVVREVHIYADADDPGRKAAALAAETHEALGREVKTFFPREGLKDFNDVIIADADGSFN